MNDGTQCAAATASVATTSRGADEPRIADARNTLRDLRLPTYLLHLVVDRTDTSHGHRGLCALLCVRTLHIELRYSTSQYSGTPHSDHSQTTERDLLHGRCLSASGLSHHTQEHDQELAAYLGFQQHAHHHDIRAFIQPNAANHRSLRATYTEGFLNLLSNFSIHGRFFDVSLLFRELIEVLLQSYQLWTLSHSVSRPWINNFAVAAVVLNCWSLPIVNVFLNHNEARRRLMCLVVDMYLDFACAVVVPVFIMLPYLLDFDSARGQFPSELLFSDIWYANAVAEGRQVMVTSYLDFLSSLLPQYSIYSCLRLLKQSVQRSSTATTTTKRGSIVPKAHVSMNRVIESTAHIDPRRSKRRIHAMIACLAMWGATILGMHVNAAASGSTEIPPGCLLRLRPWLTTQASCSVKVIHCRNHEISGHNREISLILAQLERIILTRLVFVSCPALEIPAVIRKFPALNAMLIIHSNLMSWPIEAAITHATHPSFVFVQFINTTLDTIPRGILHGDLPRPMVGFGAAFCKITIIPDDIGDVWSASALEHISFESTRVPSLPASMNKIKSLRKLWITETELSALPNHFFGGMRLTSLRVSGSPLTSLPVMNDTSSLSELYAEHANISTLPAWVATWLNARAASKETTFASFFGSPVCAVSSSAMVVRGICDADAGTASTEYSPKRIQAAHPA